jgi:molybdopterin-guanine dinucleotide biosynthesis protein MobB
MVALTGPSGSGKTTLIEQLIRWFDKNGYRTGAIKHSHAEIRLESCAKDSARMADAGARTVLTLSGKTVWLRTETDGPLSPQEAVRRFMDDFDLVLVEGWKESALPQIRIAPDTDGGPLPDRTVAFVGSGAPTGTVPSFLPHEIERIATFILTLPGSCKGSPS